MNARIIFDLDGTIDSAPDIQNIAKRALQKLVLHRLLWKKRIYLLAMASKIL